MSDPQDQPDAGAAEQICIACAQGNHQLCLGGRCECIHRLSSVRKHLAGASDAPHDCRIGVYCRKHDFIHGAEAEELRERIVAILDQVDHEGDDAAEALDRALRIMLDDVDARDSLAFVEHRQRSDAGRPVSPPPEIVDCGMLMCPYERTVKSIATMLGWENVPPQATLEREINALKARAKEASAPAIPPHHLEVLVGARDVLAAFAKQVAWLPEQGGYSTRMTDAERNVAQAIGDLTSIIETSSIPAIPPRAEPPQREK